MTFYDANLVFIQATFTGLLLALSVQVPMRMGVFSFAGAGAYGLGAYSCGILVVRYELNAAAAILLTVIGCATVTLLLGILIAQLNGLYLAMATVAFDLTIGVIAINGGELTGGSTGLYGVITEFDTEHLMAITLLALVLVALTERGALGRRIEAVRDDPELAASIGINVRRYRLAAFAVSGALGASGGAMNLLVRSYIGPLDIGFGLIVLALTMIIVGGSLSWRGAVIGCLIFTWLPDVLAGIGEWQELVYGAIVAVAAVMLPNGLYGLYRKLKRQFTRRRRGGRPPDAAAYGPEGADGKYAAVGGGTGGSR